MELLYLATPMFVLLVVLCFAIKWYRSFNRQGEETKNLEGLGGWLIVLGFGLVYSPIRMIEINEKSLPLYTEFFKEGGALETLTTPGNEGYHPIFAYFVIGDIIINAILFILSLFVLFLFFSKKRKFPKFWIGLTIAATLYIFIKVLLSIPASLFDYELEKELVRGIWECLIWIPYLVLSKRVKATFIR